MARSDDFLSFRGRIGNLIFFSRNGKTFVKKKTGGFVNGKSNEHPNTKASQKNFSEVVITPIKLHNLIIHFVIL